MSQRLWFEVGGIRRAAEIVEEVGPRTIFLVTGKASFEKSGAREALRKAMGNRRTVHFRDFKVNPEISDVQKGLALFREQHPDLIVAVGGGTVLDMAKLIGALATQDAPTLEIVTGREPVRGGGVPVLAVPTTAGTGGEATHFAAVYVHRKKYSVAHPSMLPAYAIVDPVLSYSLPAHLTAVTGMDAFAQAVESMWSVQATEQSSACAREAIRLARAHLQDAVDRPSPESRQAMSRAALLSGQAINLSKTTAPHAISYAMTSHFGVPHGQAVALTLGPVLVFNREVTSEDVNWPRGVEGVRAVIDEIVHLLGCRDSRSCREWIGDFMKSIGLSTRLREVGIRSEQDREILMQAVDPERLANNPRAFSRKSLSRLLNEIA